MPFLRTISYLAIFFAVNGFIWWGIHTRHENRVLAELESFTKMEMAIVHSAARATKSWLEARIDPAVLPKSPRQSKRRCNASSSPSSF